MSVDNASCDTLLKKRLDREKKKSKKLLLVDSKTKTSSSTAAIVRGSLCQNETKKGQVGVLSQMLRFFREANSQLRNQRRGVAVKGKARDGKQRM